MGLLTSLVFTGDLGSFDFLSENCRTQTFTPSYTGRITDRPRMQSHGVNPVVPYKGGVQIDHEGMLVALSQEDLIAVRDEFNTALLGRLDGTPSLRRDGTLTVEYAGWAESASVDVVVESQQCVFSKDNPRQAPFSVSWLGFKPYLLGDSSGDLYYL